MNKQKLWPHFLTHGRVGLFTLLAGAGLAAAQEPAPLQVALSEKDFLADMPIVLSVSRLPQRLDETPGAVTLIDREMIRLSGARDVADLLRLVPGFQTSNSFESGAPLASYHGGFERFSTRIQVLIDGRSVYSPFMFGGTGHGMQGVALADIERIEVLRGSNSAAYGSRAMLGVVNIVTRHTLDTLGLQAGLTSGENGVRDAQAHIGWSQQDASFRLGLDRRADDGLNGSNGHNQINRVNFRADVRATASDQIEVRAGGLDINSGKGFANKPGDPLRDRSFSSGYVQFDWRRNLGPDQDLALNFSHSQETHKDDFLFSLLPILNVNDNIVLDTGGRALNDSVTLQHTARYGSDVRVIWGGEFRRERVTSRPLFNTDATLDNDFTRLFGNVEWRLARDWILNAGAMVENSSVSGSSLAPRLMLNWHVAQGQTLRAGISKAFRPPSAFEESADVRFFFRDRLLRVDTLASGKVEPEELLVRELGYLGQFPRFGLDLDVRAFHEQTGGFVDGTQSVPRDFVNVPGFAIRGLEYQLKSRPWGGAQLLFNQAYIDIDAVDPADAKAAPKLASTLTLFQKLPGGLDLSLMHQRSSPNRLPGANGSLVRIKRTDLRLGMPLRLARKQAEAAVVVQNLGSAHQDFAPEFRVQRRAFITLRIDN